MSWTYLEWHDTGVGTVLVDLVHGSLEGHCLLGKVLQILGALLRLFMGFSHLERDHREF